MSSSSQDLEGSESFQRMVRGLGDMGPMGKGIVKKGLKKEGIHPKNAAPKDFDKEVVKNHIIDSLAMFLGKKAAKKKYREIMKSMR